CMLAWLTQRLGQALLVLFVMSLIVFFGMHAIGNPVDILIGEDMNQQERLEAIARLGLDKPITQQYLSFVQGALTGNFGRSFVYNVDAIELIFQRLPATLELAIAALLFAILIGMPLGLFAGLKPDNPFSKLVMAGSIMGFSLPAFWLGLMFIMVFSVQLGWLPASGRGETCELFGIAWSWLTLNGWKHMILPAFTLALFKISLVM